MRRTFTVASLSLLATAAAQAENLHQKFGGSWNCGYISFDQPYRMACEACEKQGMEFDRGGDPECVPKVKYPGNYKPLKGTVKKRIRDFEEAEDADAQAGDLPGPPGDTPDYGKSGVSRREGGTTRVDETPFTQGMGVTREEILGDLRQVKIAVGSVLSDLRNGRFDEAMMIVSSHQKRWVLSGGSRRSLGHLTWLHSVMSVEVERGTVEQLRRAIADGVTTMQEGGARISKLRDARRKQAEYPSEFSGYESAAFWGERAQYALMRRFHKTHMRQINSGNALIIDGETSSQEQKKKQCEETAEGTYRKDSVTGAWGCQTKPISREEIDVFISEYDDYIKNPTGIK